MNRLELEKEIAQKLAICFFDGTKNYTKVTETHFMEYVDNNLGDWIFKARDLINFIRENIRLEGEDASV